MSHQFTSADSQYSAHLHVQLTTTLHSTGLYSVCVTTIPLTLFHLKLTISFLTYNVDYGTLAAKRIIRVLPLFMCAFVAATRI